MASLHLEALQVRVVRHQVPEGCFLLLLLFTYLLLLELHHVKLGDKALFLETQRQILKVTLLPVLALEEALKIFNAHLVDQLLLVGVQPDLVGGPFKVTSSPLLLELLAVSNVLSEVVQLEVFVEGVLVVHVCTVTSDFHQATIELRVVLILAALAKLL